jgi:hypothetical protein
VAAPPEWPPRQVSRPEPRAVEMPSAVVLREGAGFLASLRAEFPRLAFVADPVAGMWFAVGAGGFFLRARTAIELRDRLLASGGGRRG